MPGVDTCSGAGLWAVRYLGAVIQDYIVVVPVNKIAAGHFRQISSGPKRHQFRPIVSLEHTADKGFITGVVAVKVLVWVVDTFFCGIFFRKTILSYFQDVVVSNTHFFLSFSFHIYIIAFKVESVHHQWSVSEKISAFWNYCYIYWEL